MSETNILEISPLKSEAEFLPYRNDLDLSVEGFGSFQRVICRKHGLCIRMVPASEQHMTLIIAMGLNSGITPK